MDALRFALRLSLADDWTNFRWCCENPVLLLSLACETCRSLRISIFDNSQSYSTRKRPDYDRESHPENELREECEEEKLGQQIRLQLLTDIDIVIVCAPVPAHRQKHNRSDNDTRGKPVCQQRFKEQAPAKYLKQTRNSCY